MRRGLTLVEILAATVILAAMAAAAMPLLQRALRDLDDAPPSFDLRDLTVLADAVAATPEAFGIDDLANVRPAEIKIPWPEDLDRLPVVISLLPIGGEEPDHAWLSVSCGGWEIYRWIPLEENEGVQP